MVSQAAAAAPFSNWTLIIRYIRQVDGIDIEILKWDGYVIA